MSIFVSLQLQVEEHLFNEALAIRARHAVNYSLVQGLNEGGAVGWKEF